MKIIKSGAVDNKHHKVILYNAIIDEEEMTTIFDRLFKPLSAMDKVANTIKDSILQDYIKTCVANEFLTRVEIDRSQIYKITVNSKLLDFDMMLSLHDKLDEVYY
jgi:hypothetical protein